MVLKSDKKHIWFVSGFDLNNKKSWSGTCHVITSALKEKFSTAEISFVSFPRLPFFLQAVKKIYKYLFFIPMWSNCRDLFSFPVRTKFLEKKLSENIPDTIFFFADDFCVTDRMPKTVTCIAYLDAVIQEILPYYQNCNKIGRTFFDRKTQEMLNRMNIIFTLNEWTRKELIENYHLNKERIYNVGFGINVQPYHEEKNYKEELLLIVLKKGKEKHKGLHLLLEAFRLLRSKNPHVRLAVVGTELKPEIPGVEYYYNYPREKTVELFKASTLYVMPALAEPNGITYLEALANKTPIVGINRFAFPEFSGYGEWGWGIEREDPVELADVLHSALQDKERLQQMGIKGQEFVMKRYKWDIVTQEMYDIMAKA